MMLYALIITFYVGTSPTANTNTVPQSIEIGRYDPGFCNKQASIANKLFKGVVYRCVPAGPFVDSGKIPN